MCASLLNKSFEHNTKYSQKNLFVALKKILNFMPPFGITEAERVKKDKYIRTLP